MTRTRLVCGTDTGVGKTVITALLAAAALAQGRSVRVLKPIQTGADADDDAAEVNRLVEAEVAVCGWRLAAPVAPAVAARLQGRRLEPGEILEWTKENAAGWDEVLVETVGGVAVEIVEGYDMAQLAADLGYPALVVCRPGLGTLNHTSLTVEHLRRAGVEVESLVVCGEFNPEDLSHTTNPGELERLTGVGILARVPWLDLEPGALPGNLAGVAAEVIKAAGGVL
jgi:dethiobiotin synthetase